MTKKQFEKLKVGDKVLLTCGDEGTISEVGPSGSTMIKIKQKKFACPYFYRHEIKNKIN